MAELGLLGCSVPQEYGGAGMDYISLGIVSEELEYVDTSLRVIMSVHAGLNCLSLLTWGTEDQKQRYLVPQAQGKKIATYGLTEPAAGSDVRGIQTVAIKKGDRYSHDRREDVDLARRRRRQLPRLCLDGSGEEEAARHLRHQRLHRRAQPSRASRARRSRRSGASSPAIPAPSRWKTSKCRPKTSSAGKAKDSRSRCSRSTRGATRSRPGPPA